MVTQSYTHDKMIANWLHTLDNCQLPDYTVIIKNEITQGSWRKYVGPLRTIFPEVWGVSCYLSAGLFLGSVCCFSGWSASIPHCYGYRSIKKTSSKQIFQSCFLWDLSSISNINCLASDIVGAAHPSSSYGWDLTESIPSEDVNQDVLSLVIHAHASVFSVQAFCIHW